jgi:hypothetical protein
MQTTAAKTPRMNSESLMAVSCSSSPENTIAHALFPAIGRRGAADRGEYRVVPTPDLTKRTAAELAALKLVRNKLGWGSHAL